VGLPSQLMDGGRSGEERVDSPWVVPGGATPPPPDPPPPSSTIPSIPIGPAAPPTAPYGDVPPWAWPPVPPTGSRQDHVPRRWGLAGPVSAILIVVVLGIAAVILTLTTESADSTDSADAADSDRQTERRDRTDGSPNGPRSGESESENLQARWVDPALADSNLLVTSGDTICSTREGVLFCLDAETGDQIFAEALPNPGTLPNGATLPPGATSPALVGETLVVADYPGPGGSLYGYSLDGRRLWEARVEGASPLELPGLALTPGSPLVAGDVVVTVGTAAGGNQQLVAIDAATGQERWRGPAEPLVHVVVDGQRVYSVVTNIDTLAQSIIALDPASGAELWRMATDPAWGQFVYLSDVMPLADGSIVGLLMQGEPSRLVVVDAATGERRWELQLDTTLELASQVALVASVDDVTVVADASRLSGHDSAGRELWSVAMPVSGIGRGLGGVRLVVDQGRLFTVGTDVFEIEPDDGSKQLVREVVFASDVAVAGDLLVIATAGELEAVPLP
jgi:outer membrane protein assembly factor BamB